MLASLKPDYYFAFEAIGLHKMRKGEWAMARDAFADAYRQAPDEYYYALLSAINWMRADNLASPRQYLNQVLARVRRDSIEYYMVRLYYDLTGRVYNGENDMLLRLGREPESQTKSRMLFYMAQYYDVRGNQNMANRFYEQFRDANNQAIPEWRLAEWIMIERGLLSN
jgi:predicted Zn-dependent protease